MRILMVNARATPFGGAIAQYTDRLCEALRDLGDLDIERLELADWGRKAWPEVRRAIRVLEPGLVHVQYPMEAYGRSVVPHLMALRWRTVVTLHEASAFGTIQALARLGPLTARAPAVIVSSEFERRWLSRRMPWTAGRLSVVPVGNNIGVAAARDRAPERIVTFGTLRPWRGFDAVLALARLARANGLPWEIRVIGASAPQHERFAQRFHRLGEEAGIQFVGQLPADGVAKELAEATVGYFPFPGGASERHGSLIAALANGLPVVATVGERTPAELARAVSPCTSPSGALTTVTDLLGSAEKRAALSGLGRRYAETCSWPLIAARHREIYGELASGPDFRQR
jgi:glycosyltransferase involved in cell wall biosynthesis